jgi:hypothetical protein
VQGMLWREKKRWSWCCSSCKEAAGAATMYQLIVPSATPVLRVTQGKHNTLFQHA